jgi:hypothetical protein
MDVFKIGLTAYPRSCKPWSPTPHLPLAIVVHKNTKSPKSLSYDSCVHDGSVLSHHQKQQGY